MPANGERPQRAWPIRRNLCFKKENDVLVCMFKISNPIIVQSVFFFGGVIFSVHIAV